MDGMIKAKSLASGLGVSVRTIRRWIKLGMPVHKVGGTLYFDTKEVRKWMLSR